MKKDTESQAWQVAYAFLGKHGTHDISHVKRVYKVAIHIGKQEGGDLESIKFAAILHDIGRPIEDITGEDHAYISANIARRLLTLWKVSQKTIDTVYDAILNHRFSKGRTPQTLEGKIISDADKIDALGAVGIVRVFKHDCNRSITQDIQHFYEKILKLPEMMYTPTGYKIAIEKKKFVIDFLEQLEEEIKGEI